MRTLLELKIGLSNRTLSFLLFLLIPFQSLSAQSASSTTQHDTAREALARWIQLDAPPGWEHLATDVLMKVLPAWRRDTSGNLMLRKGSGTPRRVVACALDRPGFAVTEITPDGYIRLRESGTVRQHQLWAQFHEGQRIRVLTRSGSVPGVVGVKSTHLQRGRTAAQVTTLDDLWVDVGGRSKLEVEQLGIQLLDPVVRDLPAWSFADVVSGPSAGARVGCAAVASAAQGEVTNGETVFLLSTLRSFGNDGLEAALRKLGRIDELFLIDPVAVAGAPTEAGVRRLMVQNPSFLPETAGITSVVMLSPEVRFADSLVESIEIRDAEVLLSAVEKIAAVTSRNNQQSPRWVVPAPVPMKASVSTDALGPLASLLGSLSDLPAVSGHEGEMRRAILEALPATLRSRVVTDAEGDLVLELGPARDPVMFIAHQDEVGFEITSIAADGSVSLRSRGGLYTSLWEGQPALLHFDRGNGDSQLKAPLRGVFLPRATATTKQPEALIAWFGLDATELNNRGVRVGQSVTGYKRATRLGPTRFTARALDDRTGTAALILAAKRIDPTALRRRVIFAWSVREETGLEGARVLAKHYANSLSRVYSIDTFVSSDSPLESTRFAFAPLGKGAVIRALDNASVSSAADIDRVMQVARRQVIPLQVGATNGGADGSEFVRYGVAHVGLSWPGRYSHSPVEVLDLRDLEALERLIYALAVVP
jgi:putative aminopeptidase FrvX